MTMNDFNIISLLLDKNTFKLKGLSVKEICSETNLSSTKVRQALYGFSSKKFVEEGISNGKEKTYYITSKGISFLNHLKKEDEYFDDENIEEKNEKGNAKNNSENFFV